MADTTDQSSAKGSVERANEETARMNLDLMDYESQLPADEVEALKERTILTGHFSYDYERRLRLEGRETSAMAQRFASDLVVMTRELDELGPAAIVWRIAELIGNGTILDEKLRKLDLLANILRDYKSNLVSLNGDRVGAVAKSGDGE